MKKSKILKLCCFASLGLVAPFIHAADEDALMTRIQPTSEQTVGHGRSALWTLPVAATQYLPAQPTAAMQAALVAEQEGRFLDALIQLDEVSKNGEGSAEVTLLRASFLLQGGQPQQAVENLASLLSGPYAANAWALTAMGHLQQGQMAEALAAAQKAQGLKADLLASLAMSYALQGQGKLVEARQVMRDFNGKEPGGARSSVALAREAELALTVGQIGAARVLVAQARDRDAAHPYVIAVGGLVALIDGKAAEAKAAFEVTLRRDPRDAKALFGLGLAEIRLGHVAAGQAKLLAADDADPNNSLILTYLGRAQQRLGQTEAARASWRQAQQADPRDPVPWLYQAQAELQANQPQANQPQDARDSLREAKTRLAYRAVYRGDRLLGEDDQLLAANQAEVQRQLGMDSLAFQTLASGFGNKSSVGLRNQADLLKGRRFGESARRSLLLQSLFNERPGNLPATLDLYGDGAGMTGAGSPQHGFISELGAQQTSYNNYDDLFSQRARIEAEALGGGRNSMGGQVRAGIGSEVLGIGVAHMQFTTDGFTPEGSLDNRAFHAILQWRPEPATQVFLSRQNFDSDWSSVFFPALPWAMSARLADSSQVTRLGLRRDLGEDGNKEIRALLSRQETVQNVDTAVAYTGVSSMHSAELQYRQSGSAYATQWGMQQLRGDATFDYASGGIGGNSIRTQHVYAAWQQTLSPAWQIDSVIGWRMIEAIPLQEYNRTYLKSWLPQLGVVYTPDAQTHVRLATWKNMAVSAPGGSVLAPVTIAGLLLVRPDDMASAGGQLVRAQALAIDRQLSPELLLAGEVRQRRTDLPHVEGPGLGQTMAYFRNDESRLAAHWQPRAQPWILSLAYDYERVRNDETLAALDSVNEQTLRAGQLELRWFVDAQWTTNLAFSHNRVTGSLNSMDMTSWTTVFPEYRSSFNQVDASVQWKFGGPLSGQLTAGVRNAGDHHFQYVDVDKLNPRFSDGRLMYARIRLAW